MVDGAGCDPSFVSAPRWPQSTLRISVAHHLDGIAAIKAKGQTYSTLVFYQTPKYGLVIAFTRDFVRRRAPS